MKCDVSSLHSRTSTLFRWDGQFSLLPAYNGTKIINKIDREFPELWSQMYFHLFAFSLCYHCCWSVKIFNIFLSFPRNYWMINTKNRLPVLGCWHLLRSRPEVERRSSDRRVTRRAEVHYLSVYTTIHDRHIATRPHTSKNVSYPRTFKTISSRIRIIHFIFWKTRIHFDEVYFTTHEYIWRKCYGKNATKKCHGKTEDN